jgi:hypothetical protein
MSALGADKMGFWKGTPRGANMSSTNPESDFAVASSYGIRLVRVGATGSPGDLRFLVTGEAPHDEWDLSEENINRLKEIVALAAKQNQKIIMTLAHVPGRQWEYRKRDHRIWHDEKYQQQFVEAWKILANALKNEAAVVGYDLFNEPYLPQDSSEWLAKLWDLYERTVVAIRTVDSNTPIIFESANMASAASFKDMPVFGDKNTIYSFHYYEPFPYFSPPLNKGNLAYPGMLPSSEGGEIVWWNKATHLERLKPVIDWQIKNHIEGFRIFVGEFGGWRKAKGAKLYLQDLCSLFDRFGWSWSYYAFRERDWDVADLELEGQSKIRRETDLFQALKRHFN